MAKRVIKKELSFAEMVQLIRKAGLENKSTHEVRMREHSDNLGSLTERIQGILQITNRQNKTSQLMLYFIMYDIQNNKVRRLIAKYLEKKGCLRVQKSIFFVDSDKEKYEAIIHDLKVVKEAYNNEDSIFIVPVSNEQIRSMKVLGQSVDFEIVINDRGTLFF